MYRIMQVILKNILKAYSGKCDGLIYYYHPGLDRLLCRRHTIPKRSESNQRFAEIAASLKALQPSEGFWMDLRHYAALVSVKGRYLNAGNCYFKLMYALARGFGVDLRTITRAEIDALDLPCRSVKRAIQAGLLQSVAGYERLDSLF